MTFAGMPSIDVGVDVMTGSADLPQPPPPKRRLPRWVGVVFPVVLLGGAGILLLQGANRVWLPVTVTIGAAAALGLAAGFAVRWSVHIRSDFVRWTIALGSLTVGLLTAGLFSQGAYGIGALFPLRLPVEWSDVAQLVVGALAAWLAIRGFSRPPAPQPAAEPAAQPTPLRWSLPDPRAVDETQPRRAGRRPATALVNRVSPAPPAPSVRLRPPAGGSIRGRLSAGVQARLQRASFHLRRRFARGLGSAPWSGWLRRRRQETPIRISTLGEDRCPYCLDLVDPRDRRGVKLCPVCHTPHHADCWSITGMCQMPHLYGEAHATRTGAAR